MSNGVTFVSLARCRSCSLVKTITFTYAQPQNIPQKRSFQRSVLSKARILDWPVKIHGFREDRNVMAYMDTVQRENYIF